MGKIGQGDGHAWGVGEAGTSMGAGGGFTWKLQEIVVHGVRREWCQSNNQQAQWQRRIDSQHELSKNSEKRKTQNWGDGHTWALQLKVVPSASFSPWSFSCLFSYGVPSHPDALRNPLLWIPRLKKNSPPNLFFFLLCLCLPQQAILCSTAPLVSKDGVSDHQHGLWHAHAADFLGVGKRGPPLIPSAAQLL